MIAPREQAPTHMFADTTLVKVHHVAKPRICGEEGTTQGQDWEVGSLVVPAPVSHISCLGPAPPGCIPRPTPVFLPGEFYEQRRLVGYSAWDHEESDSIG